MVKNHTAVLDKPELSLEELLAATARLDALLGSTRPRSEDANDESAVHDEDWDPYSACRPKPRDPTIPLLELRLENLTIVEQEQTQEEEAVLAV